MTVSIKSLISGISAAVSTAVSTGSRIVSENPEVAASLAVGGLQAAAWKATYGDAADASEVAAVGLLAAGGAMGVLRLEEDPHDLEAWAQVAMTSAAAIAFGLNAERRKKASSSL